MSPGNSKSRLRREYRTARDALGLFTQDKASEACCAQLLAELRGCKRVALYAAMHSELNLRLLHESLHKAGVAVALPRMAEQEPDRAAAAPPLQLYVFAPHLPLVKNRWGVPEPDPRTATASIAADTLDAIVVPGLAFGRDGSRLGYGKGCYDQLLANVSGRIIGAGYATQLCAALPQDPHDVRMQYFACEQGVQALSARG